MPEPIILMDQLAIVTPCAECKNEVKLPFSLAMAQLSVDCGVCGTIIRFRLTGGKAEAIEKGFQEIQAQIRDAGCFVDVRPST